MVVRVGRPDATELLASRNLTPRNGRERVVESFSIPKARGAGDGVSPVARVFPRDSSERQDRESGHLEVPWKTRIAIVPKK